MSASDTFLKYLDRPISEHPNYERAIGAIAASFPNAVNHWRGIYNQRPYLLDLDTSCPKCEAKPFWPCTTPTGYTARTHAARRKHA